MKILSVAFAATLAMAGSAALAATNWLTVVDTTGGGHAIGNPRAKVAVTEFVSYTCAHCARFALESSSALDVYVATGKIRLDIRHVLRDPVDLTAAMIANCGPKAKFPRNHAALMLSQPKWLPIVSRASAAQTSRWYNGPGSARRRAVAADLNFYAIMAPRGYDRVTIDKCLADESLATRLAAQSKADDAKWNIAYTPSFAIDGTLLAGTSDWNLLRMQIDARL